MSKSPSAQNEPDSEEKRAYHHGDLAPALIAAAARVITEEGIEGLSLREVARRAGVSVAAPYRHFESKRDLLAAVATAGFDRFAEVLREDQPEPEADPFDRLTHMGRRYVQFATEHSGFIQVMFGFDFEGLGDLPKLEASGKRCFTTLHEFVRGCLGEDAPDMEVQVTAITAWSMVHGLSALINSKRIREFDTPEKLAWLTEAVLARFQEALHTLVQAGRFRAATNAPPFEMSEPRD